MIINGKYNFAKVFTENIDKVTISQIETFLDQDFSKDTSIRIMPDCHAGIGSVIGFTADLKDKVIPNIVGVDIGCGMLVVELGKISIDLQKLDETIQTIPSGFKTHKKIYQDFKKLETLNMYKELKDPLRLKKSIGTLGGGNHFIEIDKDDDDNLYLVIHSGSRNLGTQVAKFYQNLALENCIEDKELVFEKRKLQDKLNKSEDKKETKKMLKKVEKSLKKSDTKYPKDLCYIEGRKREEYLEDMFITQEYASLNRRTIANIILEKMWNKNIDEYNNWETVHNYIDLDSNIIRKGAISAKKDEKVLIPMNMRDGALICIGKGNPQWNYSAPHGAGRLMSRRDAFDSLNMEEFKNEMKDIYSTSISTKTLDEAPMAYKPTEEIINSIEDTVTIIKQIKPIYNYKSSD